MVAGSMHAKGYCRVGTFTEAQKNDLTPDSEDPMPYNSHK